jgi:hypothetical protein
MTDNVIRPDISMLLITLQASETALAVQNALTDNLPCDIDSVSYNGPYKSEQSNESNGTFVSPAPLVTGQPSTFSFRARLRGIGAGASYSASVRPPLHAALAACGWYGQFSPLAASTALASGTAFSATLPPAFSSTAQFYRGQPMVIGGAPAAGRRSLVQDYSAARLAVLADTFSGPLSATNTAMIPANWTYAPTSPTSLTARTSMHPCATISWIEDFRVKTLMDCRGTVDFEGESGKPGYAVFNFTGIYVGDTDNGMPDLASPIVASAPLLVTGASGVQPAFQMNRRPIAISKWSLKNSGQIEAPDDPNTSLGFGAGQIAGRTYMFETDPLLTQLAVRNAIAEIANYARYPATIQMGSTDGNSVSMLLPMIQPVETSPGMRGKLRSETLRYQALSPSKDYAGRDADAILCFS